MSLVTSTPTTLTTEVADDEAASGLPERFAFRQAANGAQAFGHDAAGMGEIAMPVPRADFPRDGERCSCSVGRRPHSNRAAVGYLAGMNILLLMVVLLLLFGGGGFYFGGPVIGGSGLGLILLICLVLFFMGGFRTRKS
jgi:hypothetical protein